MTETCLTNTHTKNNAQGKIHSHIRHATQNYIQNYFVKSYGGISPSKMIYPYFTDFVYLSKGERNMATSNNDADSSAIIKSESTI